jgi:hypothetical protein
MTPPYDLSIPGWMTEDELRWLHETAKSMASVVEIGCYQGRSTFALLQGTALMRRFGKSSGSG